MIHKEFQENLNTFSDLIKQLDKVKDENIQTLIKRYTEQNICIINDILSISIENLKRLQNTNSANEIICAQARFTTEVSEKLSLSAQRFLNASLGHISDYNEWLKAHCDLATD